MQSASFIPQLPANTYVGSTPASRAPRPELGRHAVSLLPMVTAFFSSLSPGYTPISSAPVAFAASDSTRHPDWSETTAGIANQLKLASNIAASWLPQLRVVSEAVTAVCSSISLANDFSRVIDKKDDHKPPNDSQSSNRGAKAAAFTLLAMDTLSCAAATNGERGSAQNPITVPDSTTLSQIGQTDYPTDAYYLQTQSFSHNRTEPGVAFGGHYDGGCHTITNLNTCLFSNLEPYANVRNLRLSNGTIDGNRQYLAVLACEMAPHARSSNIRVEHSRVTNRRAGTSGEPTATGVITGHQHRAAQMLGSELHNCAVISSQPHALTGALGGLIDGVVKDAIITHSHVKSAGSSSPTGIGAGQLNGHINGLAVFKSQANTTGRSAVAGIGAGLVMGSLEQLTVAKCQVYTTGKQAHAGIGAGQTGDRNNLNYGFVDDLISVDSQVNTTGSEAATAIAVGQLNGENNKVISVRSSAKATGHNADASVGQGDDTHNTGESRNQVIVNSTVDSEYGIASLGLGTVRRITSFNNKIIFIDRIKLNKKIMVNNTLIVNDTFVVNGTKEENKEIILTKKITIIDAGLNNNVSTVDSANLCRHADPRLVHPNCTVTSPLLNHNCSSSPLDKLNSTFRIPIEINDTETLNRIGQSADYPTHAHYLQTSNLNGSQFNNNTSLIFSGHYDGQNHVIEGLPACLFKHLRGTVRNLHLTRAQISADDQSAGVVACKMSDTSTIDNITVSDSQVATRGPAMAGIICGERAGLANQITRVEVTNSSVSTQGNGAHAGVIAGQCHGQTHQATIHNSQASTDGYGACAGVGGGTVKGRLAEATFTCSRAATNGTEARAGIGAGAVSYGRVGPMTVIDGEVHTRGRRANAGTGAGDIELFGAVGDINVLKSNVLTEGKHAGAGIGAGNLEALRFARSYGVRSIGCQVRSEGDQAHAGISIGSIDVGSPSVKDERLIDRIANFTSIDNTVTALGQRSHGSVHGVILDRGNTGQKAQPVGSVVVNTRVSDGINNIRFLNQDSLKQNASTLCASADPRFVQPDCQISTDALAQNCPLPPALLIATPPLAGGMNIAVVTALVVGGAFLLGAGVFGAYWYIRHRETQTHSN